jgi:FkbM family methyltransferase
MVKKIKNVYKLIIQGYSLKDKFSIFLYYALKIFGVKDFLFDTKLKNKSGIFWCGKKPDALSHSSEDYELEVQKVLNIREGVFVDVGANIGHLSINVAKNPKTKVYSFEPEASNIKVFEKNISLNHLKNISLIKKGLSDEEGFFDFYVLGENSGGNSLLDTKKGGRKVKIPVTTLDVFYKENKIERLDFLKIDVEGAEIKVLNGGKKTLKKFKPKIIFESWDEKSLEKVKEFLFPLGYEIKKIDNANNYLAIFNLK